MSKLKPGDQAPPFHLPDQHGDTVSLDDFSGKPLLIYFYPRADTPGCTKQSCAVSQALPELGRLGVAALGISPDTPARLQRFDDKYGLSFPLLADEDHSVAEAYGAWGEKVSFGKRREGIIRSSFLIAADGTIAATWYGVKPGDTVPKAIEAIEAIAKHSGA